MTEQNENQNETNLKEMIQKAKETLLSVVDLKNRANEFFKLNDYDTAIDFNEKAKEIIKKEILEQLVKEELRKDPEVVNLIKDVNAQNLVIHSNLALFYKNKGKIHESVEHDLKVINNFDPLFDKSYFRLIINYIALNKIENAVYHYQQMKRIFDEATMTSKYDKLFKDLLANNEKFKKALEAMTKEKRSNRRGYMSYIIFFVVIMIAYFLYNQYKSKPVEEEVF
jgi:tetratricopeptide (TPR) repeat protein